MPQDRLVYNITIINCSVYRDAVHGQHRHGLHRLAPHPRPLLPGVQVTATTIMLVTPHDVMYRRSRVALAPVYGGLPVRLYSHLATAVHQVAGDPGMVHHLVHTSIRLHWHWPLIGC